MKRLLIVGVVAIVAASVSGCSWPRCFSRGDCCRSGSPYEARMIDSQVIDGTIIDGSVGNGSVIGEMVDPGTVGNP